MNHQGGDFCLENKIKRHKLIAPKGKISNDTWRTISRGLDTVEKVQKHATELLEMKDDDSYRESRNSRNFTCAKSYSRENLLC